MPPARPLPAETVTLRGSSDLRRVLTTSAPATFEWQVHARLRAGRSAGILFGASKDGQRGYVARLDSRLGQLILARVGPWPEEERLATFPWEPLDGRTVNFRIQVGNGTARVWVKERGTYPLLEARNLKVGGSHIGFYGLDAEAEFTAGAPTAANPSRITAHVPDVGKFVHLFDQGVGESKPWYINDHCLFEGPDGWHLFGITHEQPANPMDERHFAHATGRSLGERPWTKQPFALSWDPAQGENHLWAPHVIRRGRTYHMFYCAGSLKSNYSFRIHEATSTDLRNWKRVDRNPLFEDFYDARDPMVLEDNGLYYMYYTANLDSPVGNHVVNVRTSKDLKKWSPARVAFVHPAKGTFGGPTESPFVVKYGDHFYLFCGPDGSYRTTKVYRSPNPYAWSHAEQIYSFPSHAAEVVQDRDGRYYATDSGWDLNGVFIAPLTWHPAK
jgi:beta-fructofuranosidase